MYIQIPVKIEVIAKNEAICTQGKFEDGKVVIEMDVRRRDYKKLWNVPRGECIRWINERTFEIQELSSFAWPIVYRITTADGYYQNNGECVYVTPALLDYLMFLKPLLYLQFYPHEVRSYSLVEEKVGVYTVLKLRPTVSLYIYFKVKKGRLKKDRRTKVINPLFFTMG